MADKKITALTSMGVTDAAGEDFLHIIDYGGGSSPVNKKVSLTNLFSQLNLDTTIYGASKTFEIGFGAAVNSALKVATAAANNADATVTINDDGNAFTDFLVKSDASDSALKVDAGANTVTVNGDGVDVDFTVNGLNVNKLIHADAGTDVVGIGVATPDTAFTLDVAATGTNAIKAAGAVTVTGAISATTTLTADHIITSGTESASANATLTSKAVSLLSIDGTKTYVMPNGAADGQMKTIICIVATNVPNGTVTGQFNVGTSLDFDAVGETAHMIWGNSKWNVLSNTNSLAASGHN